MNRILKKNQKRNRRKRSIRKKIFGTKDMPRVSVYRSNNHIYAQVIDDVEGKTLVASDDKALKLKKGLKGIERASEVGKDLGKKIKAKKIKGIVFDRNGFKYHGQVKALADGIREAGIKF